MNAIHVSPRNPFPNQNFCPTFLAKASSHPKAVGTRPEHPQTGGLLTNAHAHQLRGENRSNRKVAKAIEQILLIGQILQLIIMIVTALPQDLLQYNLIAV
jgi:hypothetical protein